MFFFNSVRRVNIQSKVFFFFAIYAGGLPPTQLIRRRWFTISVRHGYLLSSRILCEFHIYHVLDDLSEHISVSH